MPRRPRPQTAQDYYDLRPNLLDNDDRNQYDRWRDLKVAKLHHGDPFGDIDERAAKLYRSHWFDDSRYWALRNQIEHGLNKNRGGAA